MYNASPKDVQLVQNIVVASFRQNQGINWMLKKGSGFDRQLARLACYAFYKAYCLNGAFISDNKKGFALCYPFNGKCTSLKPLFYQLLFAFTSVRWKAIPKIFKLEAYKRSLRPEDGDYLYFWFFGVLKDGDQAGFELKNGIFKWATELQKPIYAETSMKRNKIIYERYGFETFHYYQDTTEKLEYWFMRWIPKNISPW